MYILKIHEKQGTLYLENEYSYLFGGCSKKIIWGLNRKLISFLCVAIANKFLFSWWNLPEPFGNTFIHKYKQFTKFHMASFDSCQKTSL